METGNHFFGVAAPPAPFYVAILQILFQMGGIISFLMTLNHVIQNFTEGGFTAFLMWKTKEKIVKLIEVTDLQLVTQDIVLENSVYIVVIAMNKAALARCLPLSRKYLKDKLIFCRNDPSVNIEGVIETIEEKSRNISDVVITKYDMLAISERGTKWTGINIENLEAKLKEAAIEKTESNLFQSNPLGLRADVLDAWLLRLLCGVIPWRIFDHKLMTSAKENQLNPTELRRRLW